MNKHLVRSILCAFLLSTVLSKAWAVIEIKTKPVIVVALNSKPQNLYNAVSPVSDSQDDVKKDDSSEDVSQPSQPAEPQGTENADMEIQHHPNMEMKSDNQSFIGSASDQHILNDAQLERKYDIRSYTIVSPDNSQLKIKNQVLEAGTEIARFVYKEPIFNLKDKGVMYGLFGSYTFRPLRGENVFEKFLNMYKLEGKASYGPLHYQSSQSGTIDDINDYMLEIRGLLGKDVYVGSRSMITPFLGLGWRYLNDDTGGQQSSTGDFGYERESRYFYGPVGLTMTQQLTDGWSVVASGEWDFFISGQQTTHLSDVPGGFPDLRNKQKHGYGVRGSLRLQYEGSKINVFFEPFFRYWHIEDSVTTTATGSGFIVTGLEPENKSKEVGGKIGVQF